MISLRNINFGYRAGRARKRGDTLVLDDLNLDLPAGQLIAVIGPNGAGKSTMLGIASRLLTPSAGTITVDGLDVATCSDREIATKLAVLRQDNPLTARLSVVDLVRLGRFPHSRGRLSEIDQAIVEQTLQQLQLHDLRDRYLDQLSGGQRQRAFIAMVLAQSTDYLLLDEPLNNLDPRHANEIMQLLRWVGDELGRTVIIVVHDLAAAATFADHVVAMRAGRVAAQGGVAEVMRSPVLSDVFEVPITVSTVDHQLMVSHLRRAPRETARFAGGSATAQANPSACVSAAH